MLALNELEGIAIWGARGHAKVLAEIATLANVPVVALFDRRPDISSPLPHLQVYCGEAGFKEWRRSVTSPKHIGAIAAIGGQCGADRLALMKLFVATGFSAPSLIHPTAWVSPSARLGMNCHVLAQSVVAPDVHLGDAVIVNTAATVDHECHIADGVHIAPGARICGEVELGTRSFVGAGATILPRIRVGADAVIGAGAVVTKNVPDRGQVIGCPARPFLK